MRVVLEIEGDKVTVIGPDSARSIQGATMPKTVDTAPAQPPAGLLERAKKLGAMNAGAAQFGGGAALASSTRTDEPKPTSRARKGTPQRKRRRPN